MECFNQIRSLLTNVTAIAEADWQMQARFYTGRINRQQNKKILNAMEFRNTVILKIKDKSVYFSQKQEYRVSLNQRQD